MEKKKYEKELTLPNTKTYCKDSTVIKTAWCWHINRQMNKQNRIEIPEINANIYGNLVYDKGGVSNILN